MLYSLAFILGSIWGSFCNVCIYRLPLEKNIIKGRSFCTSCEKQINWYDNIPLLSYIFLKGKCRCGKSKISLQYFIVELLSAISFVLIYYFYGVSITTLLLIILTIFFIIIFFIDIKHYIIPDSLNFSLILIGILKNFTTQDLLKFNYNLPDSLLGGALGYLIIWSIIFIYKKIRNKEAMGLGDAKLLSAFGFLLGVKSIFIILFVASVLGLLFVLPSLLFKNRSTGSIIPFGPFIILAAILEYFFNLQQYMVLN